MKLFFFFSLLFVLTYAQPYASFQEWTDSNCSPYIYSWWIYPADGSCFVVTGGAAIPQATGCKITSNQTTVTAQEFSSKDCPSLGYSELHQFPVGTCQGTTLVSVFEDVPSNSYWINSNFSGINGVWETVLVANYFSTSGCSLGDYQATQILGFAECDAGYHYYCQDGEIHTEYCSDSNCESGCEAYNDPLSKSCTLTSNLPYTDMWYDFLNLDAGAATAFQATCVDNEGNAINVAGLLVLMMLLLTLYV
mmetsp:Transcript_13100/g.17987  ORF Transcript_13100/g.17987 Transcript_13100/m.17987 type:complete len:250 (+) Transcript_13100:108-857(+)